MIAGKNKGYSQSPTRFDIYCRRGDYFEKEFEICTYDDAGLETTVDLNTAIIYTHIKKKRTDTNPVASFSQSISGNILTISLPEDVSRNMSPGRYYYDIEIYYNNHHVTFLEGEIVLSQDITLVKSVLGKAYTYLLSSFYSIAIKIGIKKFYDIPLKSYLLHYLSPIIQIENNQNPFILLQSYIKIGYPVYQVFGTLLKSFCTIMEYPSKQMAVSLNSSFSVTYYSQSETQV